MSCPSSTEQRKRARQTTSILQKDSVMLRKLYIFCKHRWSAGDFEAGSRMGGNKGCENWGLIFRLSSCPSSALSIILCFSHLSCLAPLERGREMSLLAGSVQCCKFDSNERNPEKSACCRKTQSRGNGSNHSLVLSGWNGRGLTRNIYMIVPRADKNQKPPFLIAAIIIFLLLPGVSFSKTKLTDLLRGLG